MALFFFLVDGFRIDKPNEKIDVELNDAGYGGYMYSAFFRLTPTDIKLLTTHKITAERLYVSDSDIDHGDILIRYLKELMRK